MAAAHNGVNKDPCVEILIALPWLLSKIEKKRWAEGDAGLIIKKLTPSDKMSDRY